MPGDRLIDNSGLLINDWHIGHGLLGDLYVENDGLSDWRNRNVGLRLNDWHIGNGFLGDRHFENGGLSD